MLKDTIRIGVIGVGSLGQHHARVYAGLPHARLVAVADAEPARAEEIAAKHRCLPVTDFHVLLDQVDAVSIAVPTLQHHRVARACIEAGLHVLVEKPLAATVEEAEELAALASRRGVILQVGHIERFNAGLRAVLSAEEQIPSPTLIECRRWAPFTLRGADVDVVLDLMIHDLDIALALVGAPVREIQAHGVSLVSATTDVAHARVVFRNGCVGSFSASRVAEGKVREIRLYGPDGLVMIDLLQQSGLVGRRIAGADGLPVATKPVRGDGQEPLKLELAAFVESVRTGLPPLVSGREGTAALHLAYAIIDDMTRHSAARGDRAATRPTLYETTNLHHRR